MFCGIFNVYLTQEKNIPRSAKDIKLIELKDTISKLNELIFIQTRSIDSLQKTIEHLRQELGNKQAEIDYLKTKLFGSSSEKLKAPFPSQMNLFEEELPNDRIPETIDVATHKRERKPKATYEQMFDKLPHRKVAPDTLTDKAKNCPVYETRMVLIETKISKTDFIFHPAVLDRADYMATACECLGCKDLPELQFIKEDDIVPLVPHRYVSSGLAAHVMYGKFINALPY